MISLYNMQLRILSDKYMFFTKNFSNETILLNYQGHTWYTKVKIREGFKYTILSCSNHSLKLEQLSIIKLNCPNTHNSTQKNNNNHSLEGLFQKSFFLEIHEWDYKEAIDGRRWGNQHKKGI